MKKSILVVDDDPAVVDVVQGWLKIHGYDVCTALNGTEGLRKCRFRKPDAVILDIIMPDISGTRVAEEIRDDPATGSIPIIFLTGAIRSCEVPDSHMMGGQYFLAKAFQGVELLKVVQQVLTDR